MKLIIQTLDAQRHRLRFTRDVAAHHAHRAVFTHRAGVAEDDAIDQAPLHTRQRDVPESLPAVRAKREGGLFLIRARCLHHRNQFARHERKRDEHRCQNDARHGEDDFQIVIAQPFAEETLQAEQHNEHQSRDDGRHRERQINQRDEQRLAPELKLGDGPRRRETEDDIQRHANRRDEQGEFDRLPRIGMGERLPINVTLHELH